MLIKLEKAFNKFADSIGFITSSAIILMIINVFYDVVARYYFHHVSIAMQEIEWHLFSVVILLGISYTLKEDGHVRVDVIYDNLSIKKQAFINMFGAVFFILPITFLVGLSSIDNVLEAYEFMEKSGDPGGLEYRWIVKGLIPLSFLFLFITTIGFFIKNLIDYKEIR
ncbi:TRAP transporter small permease subunit [Arcobacteraceae bacterium]|jgi:TRAP-type mannitol/chloroaromatic compound transport system permease small subunit|nr:TRAP transporter small permease subunit [Arcobacteraceae bacterium]